ADDWRWWLPLLGVLVVTGVLWRYRRGWSRALLFCWGYYCVALVPALGFTQELVLEDHYQHIALVGVVTLVAAGWAGWRERGRAPWMSHAPAAVVVGPFALLTARHSRLYSDSVTLFRATLAQFPDSPTAHHNLGFALLRAGRLPEAREQFERAL